MNAAVRQATPVRPRAGCAAALVVAACGRPESPAARARSPLAAPAGRRATARDAARERDGRRRGAGGARRHPVPAATDTGACRCRAVDASSAFGLACATTSWNAVLCTQPLLVARVETNRGFQLQTSGDVRSVPKASARALRAAHRPLEQADRAGHATRRNGTRQQCGARRLGAGSGQVFVATMAAPRRAVLAVAREERTPPREPDRPRGVDALRRRRAATREQRLASGQQPWLRLSYDPSGRPVTETSPLYERCSAWRVLTARSASRRLWCRRAGELSLCATPRTRRPAAGQRRRQAAGSGCLRDERRGAADAVRPRRRGRQASQSVKARRRCERARRPRRGYLVRTSGRRHRPGRQDVAVRFEFAVDRPVVTARRVVA